MRDFEPTISCVLPWQGSAEALRRHVLPLRLSNVPGVRLASMRTAHCSSIAAACKNSRRRSLAPPIWSPAQRIAPCGPLRSRLPLLATAPSATGLSGGFGTSAKRALGVLREARRSLGHWRASSAIDPVDEIQGEVGSGLAPRPSLSASQSAGFTGLRSRMPDIRPRTALHRRACAACACVTALSLLPALAASTGPQTLAVPPPTLAQLEVAGEVIGEARPRREMGRRRHRLT